jgi:glycosyltransferase involved in cell wall biosynthesis
MPQVSVVIPTYNRERFVIKAIDSVLDQTFTDYEIIVIDDGSSDGTRKVLEAYSDKIRYIYQKNSGVSSARNTGIGEAQGVWIAFLDSDDEWNEDYLSTQITQIKQFPYAVAHMTNAVSVSSNGERYNYFREIDILRKFGSSQCLVLERPLRLIVKHTISFLQSSIMRRDILLKAGLFDTELSIAEDLDLIVRVALEGSFTICKKELVEVYRRDEAIENLMAQSVKRGIYRFKSFGKVYARLLSSPELTLVEKATILGALSSNRRALGNSLVMAGKRLEARNYYKKSLFFYPSIRSLIKYLATFLPLYISSALVITGRHILPGEDSIKRED